MSSENDETATNAGAEKGGRATASVLTAMVVMAGYGGLPAPLAVLMRVANAAKALRSRTLARLIVDDAVLKRLAEDFEDVTLKLREFIEVSPAGMTPELDGAHSDGIVEAMGSVDERVARQCFLAHCRARIEACAPAVPWLAPG